MRPEQPPPAGPPAASAARDHTNTAAMRKITRLVGRAIADFEMIRPDDRVAVGLSGGKDSTALLHALIALRRKAPIRFTVSAFTIDQGKFLGSLEPLKQHLDRLGVEWTFYADPPSQRLVRNRVEHGCDICSRYRRRAVYEVVRKMGCNVIAFGHTADDAIEALLRNLIFTSKLKPIPPVAISSKGEFRLVRPLLYVRESIIAKEAQENAYPLVPCACSLKASVRGQIRRFVEELAATNPYVYPNLLSGALRAWRLVREQPADGPGKPAEETGLTSAAQPGAGRHSPAAQTGPGGASASKRKAPRGSPPLPSEDSTGQ